MGVVKLSTAGIRNYSKTSDFLSGNLPLSLGSFNLLETTTLATSASSVTFSGLGAYSDYKHLQVRMSFRASGAGTGVTSAYVELNGDSASNYAAHALYGQGSSVNSLSQTSAGSALLWNILPNGASTANSFGAVVLDVLDFSSSTKNSTIRYLGGALNEENVITFGSGLWANTNAVTSLSISSNFASLSKFALYGVK
jgi:hypothetical protein